MKKQLEVMKNPTVDEVCDERDLELGQDPVTQITVAKYFENGWRQDNYIQKFLTLRHWALLSKSHVEYVEDFFTRDTANPGILMKEVIQVIF